MKSISMRGLQKISAKTIQSLPHAVPIKSGTATIGLLLPMQRCNQDGLRRLIEQVDRASTAYTSEENAALMPSRSNEVSIEYGDHRWKARVSRQRSW